MKLFEGKSPAERNKIIAAIVLGVASLTSLYLAFGQSFFGGGKTTITVSASPTPRPAATSTRELREVQMPSQQEQYFDWQTTPVVYNANIFDTPDPGRNIFAFYEPPVPCRGSDCPTPIPPTPVPPKPEETPPVFIAYATPAQVFAGSRGFRLEISGDKFTPDMAIYFSQIQLPTTFVNAQKLVAEVPASMIAAEGPRQVIIQSADGKSYSNQTIFNIQPPPKPQVQYVGLIARQHANNDTAVFREQGKPAEYTARLNDIVGGRFRLVSIASDKVVFEDVNLGFRHPVPIFIQAPGADVSTAPVPGGGRRPPFQQSMPQDFPQPDPQGNPGMTQGIPGIPDNIPRYVPPNSNTNRPQRQQNPSDRKDDDGDDKPKR